MRGAKPKPIEQRIREGNPGQRRLPQPVLVGGRVSADEWPPPSALPAAGRALWEEVVPHLVEVGMLDLVDRGGLELMCVQYARAIDARKRIRRDGILGKGYNGQAIVHPAIKIEREATRLFMQLAEQYGLTPVARTRLGLAEIQRRSLQQELDRDIGPQQDYDAGVLLEANEEVPEAEVVE